MKFHARLAAKILSLSFLLPALPATAGSFGDWRNLQRALPAKVDVIYFPFFSTPEGGEIHGNLPIRSIMGHEFKGWLVAIGEETTAEDHSTPSRRVIAIVGLRCRYTGGNGIGNVIWEFNSPNHGLPCLMTLTRRLDVSDGEKHEICLLGPEQPNSGMPSVPVHPCPSDLGFE